METMENFPIHGAERADASGVVSRMITEEADTYNSSVAGIDIEAVRAGPGVGPSRVLAATSERFTFTKSNLGFPLLSKTTIPDHMIVVAFIRSGAQGSRWCRINLAPDAVLVYSAEAEHTARNLAGLKFMFAITEGDVLVEHADRLGMPIKFPKRGEVHLLAPTAKTELVGLSFSTFADHAAGGEYPSSQIADDVLWAMAHALSEEDRAQRVGRSKRIDSRQVVHDCIDYATPIERIPSVSELCIAAKVSERRLRTAFADEYDLPPTAYFRAWALDEAHRRLTRHKDNEQTVTKVAIELGFHHLGRFAGNYKKIYGETPSATLKAHS